MFGNKNFVEKAVLHILAAHYGGFDGTPARFIAPKLKGNEAAQQPIQTGEKEREREMQPQRHSTDADCHHIFPFDGADSD